MRGNPVVKRPVGVAEHERADVDGVVEHLGNVARRPRPVAPRARIARRRLSIQVVGGRWRAHLRKRRRDVDQPLAVEEHGEGQRHERRGGVVDVEPALAAHHVVAVARVAVDDLPLLHLTVLHRRHLAGRLHRVHLVDQPLEGHDDAAVALQRVEPVVHRDEAHAQKREDALQVGARLVHVAPEAAQILHGDAVDGACAHLIHERVERGPALERGACAAVVLVDADHLHALHARQAVAHEIDLGPQAAVACQPVVPTAQPRVDGAPPYLGRGRCGNRRDACRRFPRLPSHGRASFPRP